MKITLNEKLYTLLFELNLLNENIELALTQENYILNIREGLMSERDIFKIIKAFNNFNLTQNFTYIFNISH